MPRPQPGEMYSKQPIAVVRLFLVSRKYCSKRLPSLPELAVSIELRGTHWSVEVDAEPASQPHGAGPGAAEQDAGLAHAETTIRVPAEPDDLSWRPGRLSRFAPPRHLAMLAGVLRLAAMDVRALERRVDGETAGPGPKAVCRARQRRCRGRYGCGRWGSSRRRLNIISGHGRGASGHRHRWRHLAATGRARTRPHDALPFSFM